MYKENIQGETRLVSLTHFHVPATATKITIAYILNSHRAHEYTMTQRNLLRQDASVFSKQATH